MAILIGIAGPSCSGKTSLVNLIDMNKSQFNKSINTTIDLKDMAWENLLATTKHFTAYEEIYSDKEYLLIFCGRLKQLYKEIIEEARSCSDDIVVIDFTHLDLLIYMNLHFWFHYPSQDLLAQMVRETLQMKGCLDHIYMTKSNDVIFDPLKNKQSLRQRAVDFKRNRELELLYYELIASDFRNVSTLSDSTDESFKLLVEDLNVRYGVVMNERD